MSMFGSPQIAAAALAAKKAQEHGFEGTAIAMFYVIEVLMATSVDTVKFGSPEVISSNAHGSLEN